MRPPLWRAVGASSRSERAAERAPSGSATLRVSSADAVLGLSRCRVEHLGTNKQFRLCITFRALGAAEGGKREHHARARRRRAHSGGMHAHCMMCLSALRRCALNELNVRSQHDCVLCSLLHSEMQVAAGAASQFVLFDLGVDS